MQRNFNLPTLLILVLVMQACSSTSPPATEGFFKKIFSQDTFRFYRMDIPQGNVLDGKTIDRVKIGMEKKQVAYLLGNPVLPSMFHEDRWDYVYHVDSLYKKNQYYKLVLYFDESRVIRIRKTSERKTPVNAKEK